MSEYAREAKTFCFALFVVRKQLLAFATALAMMLILAGTTSFAQPALDPFDGAGKSPGPIKEEEFGRHQSPPPYPTLPAVPFPPERIERVLAELRSGNESGYYYDLRWKAREDAKGDSSFN